MSSHGIKPSILGVAVDPLDMPSAVESVFAALYAPGSYVCLAAVHGIVEARRNAELAHSYRDAKLVLPDGMPTVWIGRRQGFRSMDRVFGPDLMLAVFARSDSTTRHFLLGGNEGVAEELAAELRKRFPHANIVGTYTPPFRALTTQEEARLREQVATCSPDFLWVGMGTPKQEIFMRRYSGDLAAKVMIGVGAAFNYHTGRIADSPRWLKRAGLQWLHRLIQEPRRLWKRYLHTNAVFLALAGPTLFRRRKVLSQ